MEQLNTIPLSVKVSLDCMVTLQACEKGDTARDWPQSRQTEEMSKNTCVHFKLVRW